MYSMIEDKNHLQPSFSKMENSHLITPNGALSLKNLERMASHHMKKNQ